LSLYQQVYEKGQPSRYVTDSTGASNSPYRLVPDQRE